MSIKATGIIFSWQPLLPGNRDLKKKTRVKEKGKSWAVITDDKINKDSTMEDEKGGGVFLGIINCDSALHFKSNS